MTSTPNPPEEVLLVLLVESTQPISDYSDNSSIGPITNQHRRQDARARVSPRGNRGQVEGE
jgi:hypothetical protein